MHKQHHSQKTAQKPAPTTSGYGDLSNNPHYTAPTSKWVHEPEAAYQIETLLAGGISWKNAVQTVIREEYSDGSQECLKAIKKEANQSPLAFPEINQAVYKRNTR